MQKKWMSIHSIIFLPFFFLLPLCGIKVILSLRLSRGWEKDDPLALVLH